MLFIRVDSLRRQNQVTERKPIHNFKPEKGGYHEKKGTN